MTDSKNATREALERIARDGSAMDRPLSMDFFVAVPDQASGNRVAVRAQSLGFTTAVERDAESGEWTCFCTRVLVPAFDAVISIETQLDQIARDYGGYCDGFGTFGNGDDKS